jgi:hypothetical protein
MASAKGRPSCQRTTAEAAVGYASGTYLGDKGPIRLVTPPLGAGRPLKGVWVSLLQEDCEESQGLM